MDVQHTSELLIAYDRSMRSVDADGHMRVEQSFVSKACVSPYLGKEIPNWQTLGLDPDRTYRLFRDPAELAKGADSFTGKPLLIKHIPISAEAPRQDLVVGTVGTVTFEDPYLVSRPLMVWTADAIGLIESEQQRELSAGYRYTADMSPGTYEGQAYDGVMRDIDGQHVAIVSEGRAGPDVMVADHIPPELKMIHATAIAKLKPFLAPSADLIALDALLGEVDSTAPSLDEEIENEASASDWYQNAEEQWKKMSAADKLRARDAWHKARDAKRAKDSGPDHRKDFDGAHDAAIAADTRKQILAAVAAREAVKPIVGIIALDAAGMDTADAIYGFALKQAGVKIDGVHPSAYPALVEMAKARKPAMALDGRSGGGGYIPLSQIAVANIWRTASHGGRAS